MATPTVASLRESLDDYIMKEGFIPHTLIPTNSNFRTRKSSLPNTPIAEFHEYLLSHQRKPQSSIELTLHGERLHLNSR
ncbi:hypothetical protein HDU97_004580 [Phlyctochytrium planicorne]|nr:hypothetical protein HDU97_004580 [Phlyctochytrium planicorne]